MAVLVGCEGNRLSRSATVPSRPSFGSSSSELRLSCENFIFSRFPPLVEAGVCCLPSQTLLISQGNQRIPCHDLPGQFNVFLRKINPYKAPPQPPRHQSRP